MLTKRTNWFYLIAVIAVIGVSMLVSPAFSEGQGGTSKEGITVHGHWKIEIFNPDGKRASITEFENSLDSGTGQMYLIMLLSGQAVYGNWGVELDASAGTKPCDDGSPSSCKIGESGGYYSPMTLNSSNLNVVGNWSTAPRRVILTGSVTAANASTIDTVKTVSSYCNTTDVSISACRSVNNTIWQNFTSATLGTPPSVVPGQLIQVTVTISFS